MYDIKPKKIAAYKPLTDLEVEYYAKRTTYVHAIYAAENPGAYTREIDAAIFASMVGRATVPRKLAMAGYMISVGGAAPYEDRDFHDLLRAHVADPFTSRLRWVRISDNPNTKLTVQSKAVLTHARRIHLNVHLTHYSEVASRIDTILAVSARDIVQIEIEDLIFSSNNPEVSKGITKVAELIAGCYNLRAVTLRYPNSGVVALSGLSEIEVAVLGNPSIAHLQIIGGDETHPAFVRRLNRESSVQFFQFDSIYANFAEALYREVCVDHVPLHRKGVAFSNICRDVPEVRKIDPIAVRVIAPNITFTELSNRCANRVQQMNRGYSALGHVTAFLLATKMGDDGDLVQATQLGIMDIATGKNKPVPPFELRPYTEEQAMIMALEDAPPRA